MLTYLCIFVVLLVIELVYFRPQTSLTSSISQTNEVRISGSFFVVVVLFLC